MIKLILTLVISITALTSTSFSQEISHNAILLTKSQTYNGYVLPCQGGVEALDEVNRARAQRGLRPFIKDELLTVGALNVAAWRAQRLCVGHSPNDFSGLPSGASATSAGCAAWEPSWGWGSCCCYDNYTYGGAAYCVGSDGRRYMHLFVR